MRVIRWSDGHPEQWNTQEVDFPGVLIVYELTRLANFSEPRFNSLGNSHAERVSDLARKQLQMLRGLWLLGRDTGISLRIIKHDSKIRIFLVIRAQRDVESKIATSIQVTIPSEYPNFRRITESDTFKIATDTSYARHISVITKREYEYPSNYEKSNFYNVSLWKGLANNTLDQLCSALAKYDGRAMIDVTIVPTEFGVAERDWIENHLRYMRQAQNGEQLRSADGLRTLKTFEPMPGLAIPVKNYDELMQSYQNGMLFLFAFRVLTDSSSDDLTQGLITGATTTNPHISRLSFGSSSFETEIRATQHVYIAPQKYFNTTWQIARDKDFILPFRAQRLHRLADINEISSFFRLPIPLTPTFYGFPLDVGITDTARSSVDASKRIHIDLGEVVEQTATKSIRFDRQGLAKHGLVVGVPGSGKTTTMFNFLLQFWNHEPDKRIPFIVLEPAKTEYRALKTVDMFKDDLLVFTLGDERISPFRFNPFEVPHGIPVESHISRLNACFAGAFNLFDPLPLLLDRTIRRTYEVYGWYDDSIGGDSGLITPTITDLCEQAEIVINTSGYSDKLRDDFKASLLQRLQSLRRGSKGRMLDTRKSINFDELMQRPVILEMDSLNEDEKALMMMFILTFVYEYAKANHPSGSPLRHMLIVEEAHNLIGAVSKNSEFSANPKEMAINLFTKMLAEMRALGHGILITDQLPTAIAPEAVKQTNLKILMRMTARDDREVIGNTMDLDEAQLKEVTRFKSGQSLIYLEEWDRVERVITPNIKLAHNIEEPPNDEQLRDLMDPYERDHPDLYRPYAECAIGCSSCNRRVRNQAERLVQRMLQKQDTQQYVLNKVGPNPPPLQYESVCAACVGRVKIERIRQPDLRHELLPFCAYVHFQNMAKTEMRDCVNFQGSKCKCKVDASATVWFQQMLELGSS